MSSDADAVAIKEAENKATRDPKSQAPQAHAPNTDNSQDSALAASVYEVLTFGVWMIFLLLTSLMLRSVVVVCEDKIPDNDEHFVSRMFLRILGAVQCHVCIALVLLVLPCAHTTGLVLNTIISDDGIFLLTPALVKYELVFWSLCAIATPSLWPTIAHTALFFVIVFRLIFVLACPLRKSLHLLLPCSI